MLIFNDYKNFFGFSEFLYVILCFGVYILKILVEKFKCIVIIIDRRIIRDNLCEMI